MVEDHTWERWDTTGMTWPDWGNAPAWFSAVGTSGSLVVAVSLLARNLKERRSSQASSVSAVADHIRPWDGLGDQELFLVNIYNGSSLPIQVPSVEAYLETTDPDGTRGTRVFQTQIVNPSSSNNIESRYLAPNEHAQVRIPVGPNDLVGQKGIELRFRDAAGLSWKRHVLSGELHQDQLKRPLWRRLLRK